MKVFIALGMAQADMVLDSTGWNPELRQLAERKCSNTSRIVLSDNTAADQTLFYKKSIESDSTELDIDAQNLSHLDGGEINCLDPNRRDSDVEVTCFRLIDGLNTPEMVLKLDDDQSCQPDPTRWMTVDSINFGSYYHEYLKPITSFRDLTMTLTFAPLYSNDNSLIPNHRRTRRCSFELENHTETRVPNCKVKVNLKEAMVMTSQISVKESKLEEFWRKIVSTFQKFKGKLTRHFHFDTEKRVPTSMFDEDRRVFHVSDFPHGFTGENRVPLYEKAAEVHWTIEDFDVRQLAQTNGQGCFNKEMERTTPIDVLDLDSVPNKVNRQEKISVRCKNRNIREPVEMKCKKNGKLKVLGNPERICMQSLDKMAFGSCNYQIYENKVFDRIRQEKPDMFLLTGDAVYATDQWVDTLKDHFRWVKHFQPGFSSLRKEMPVQGIWDDHDLGPNDADGATAEIAARKDLFLDFLDVPSMDERRKQGRGLYFSKTYGDALTDSQRAAGEKGQVKVIVLDTRSARVTYYDHDRKGCNEGQGFLCLKWENRKRKKALENDDRKHEGSLLGPEQHQWFVEQIKDSTADVHIVVSSIQFLSKDKEMENWMHWDDDRDQVFAALQEHDPRGLILLSGDVHRAEKLSAGDGVPLEMTSSGMNNAAKVEMAHHTGHEIGDVIIERLKFCNDRPQVSFCFNNYGMLEFNWRSRYVWVKAVDEEGTTQLRFRRGMDERVAKHLAKYEPYKERPEKFDGISAKELLAAEQRKILLK